MSVANEPSTEGALDAFVIYTIASALAWRHNLAHAVAAGEINEKVALELTSNVVADTESLALGENVGPSLKMGSPIWKGMQRVLSEQFTEIAKKQEEQINAGSN